MSKATKKWLIAATIFVIVGLLIFAGVLYVYDFDFKKLSTENYITNTYEIKEDFDRISIDVDTSDIEFVLSEDENCRLVCYETEKLKHSAVIENGTLSIDLIDCRNWYDYIGISFEHHKMTVYLPQTKYTSLKIDTDTGDIVIPKEFAFENIKIDGDTSDVECYASVSEAMEIKLSTGDIKADSFVAGKIDLSTTTGNICINAVDTRGNIDITTNTGKIVLTEITCNNFIAESNTGNITLKNVVSTDSFSVENDTGDVIFDYSDAAEIYVETSTGDVKGNLLSEKIFITKTSTGNISVPDSVSGGRCNIITSTGDIKIDIKSHP